MRWIRVCVRIIRKKSERIYRKNISGHGDLCVGKRIGGAEWSECAHDRRLAVCQACNNLLECVVRVSSHINNLILILKVNVCSLFRRWMGDVIEGMRR